MYMVNLATQLYLLTILFILLKKYSFFHLKVQLFSLLLFTKNNFSITKLILFVNKFELHKLLIFKLF